MRTAAQSLRAATGVLLCIAWLHGSVSAEPSFVNERYRSWIVDPQPVSGDQIRVSDQFLSDVNLEVVELQEILMPVRVDGSDFADSTAYYTMWAVLGGSTVDTTVIVRNEFNPEGTTWVIDSPPRFLLTPARKNMDADPPDLNHYLCYTATGDELGITRDMEDQCHADDNQVVFRGELFCNPCSKYHYETGQDYPIRDPETHLAGYWLVNHLVTKEAAVVRDQFLVDPETVDTCSFFHYLFVPSTKHEMPTAVRKASWGRLKSMYR